MGAPSRPARRRVGPVEARRLDVAVSDDEVARYIEREGYDRAIRTADIMVPDLEAATRVLQLIEEGADFGDVARTWSANRETAARGGAIDRLATRYQMIPVLARELFPLPVGSVSRPVRVGQWYSVFKILEESRFDPTPHPLRVRARALVVFSLRRRKLKTNLEPSLVSAVDPAHASPSSLPGSGDTSLLPAEQGHCPSHRSGEVGRGKPRSKRLAE